MLLPPAEKKQLLDSLNRPVVSALAKKAIKKKIIEKCKKIAHCPYCEALNGKREISIILKLSQSISFSLCYCYLNLDFLSRFCAKSRSDENCT